MARGAATGGEGQSVKWESHMRAKSMVKSRGESGGWARPRSIPGIFHVLRRTLFARDGVVRIAIAHIIAPAIKLLFWGVAFAAATPHPVSRSELLAPHDP